MFTIFFFIFFIFGEYSCQNPSNNVCPRYFDYFNMKNNPRCWYNFAADEKVPQIIKRSGYPFMEYKVKTIDGYILTVFRIPNPGSKKPAIFMLHGVQGTAGVFVGLGRKSVAFLLYEAGYDVWLGNYRGTEYSQSHEFLNYTQPEFWDYSVDDITLKDVPAMLRLVSHYSGNRGKIIYIGHSLGTTASIMFASEYPETASKTIGLMVLLAPAYKLPNMRSPYRFLFPLFAPAVGITNFLNLERWVEGSNIRNITRPFCTASPPLTILCMGALNLFLGLFNQIAPETVPVCFNLIPGGTSLKTMIFLQDTTNNKFRKFDYGHGKNYYLYGSEEPPEYDLNKIKVPVYVMCAKNDWAISRKDCMKFYKSLPENVRYGMHEITDENFNHYDFLFGKYSEKLVTDKLVEILNKFERQQSATNRM